MAEALIGAELAAGLVDKLVSLASTEVIQVWNVDKDLDTLRRRFETIQTLLDDARKKKINMSAVEKWFNQLEDVENDTEALLDELAYEVTRRNVRKAWKRSFPSKTSLIFRHTMAGRIKSINASFDEIFGRARDLGIQPVAHLNTTVHRREIRSELPFEDNTLIVGRDKDVSNLVQIVCANTEQDLHVVAIVGMGGQGKTTLARMVFNCDDVIKTFTKRMWITVSDDFNFINILNQMVQSLTSRNLGLDNTQGLFNELQKSIKGEKFLLVLDDVWNEKSEKWDDLRNSLVGVGGARGSRVVFTTRNQKVIDALPNCVPYQVDKLQEDDSYELFKKLAFGDGGVLEEEPFVGLGRSLVKRCGGLPLAIKALGGILRLKKSEEEWESIKTNEKWASQGVLSTLRFSYDNLPYSLLKQCFLHCSIIPKGTRIDKDELIQIWMALGFLLPPPGSAALMEDIGSEYFNILLWHSLLQDTESDRFGNIKSCKMHDLVHDLAEDLSKHHSVTVKTGVELNHASNAKYVRLDNRVSDRNPTIMKRNFEKIRLLYSEALFFCEVSANIKHLTVLVLTNKEDAVELPESLQNMKYIKHLDISCLRSKLPSYITELYNLQTLRVWNGKEVSKKICNLINLRHLYIQNPYSKRRLLYGIERLTCLQTLPYFVVNKHKNCVIGQLEGLQYLRGEVKLYGLGDVTNMQEARKAGLCTKSNIQSLLLSWQQDKTYWFTKNKMQDNEGVLEGLEPHTNLKELMIECFMGKRFALWITKMTSLVKITLNYCNGCEEFSSLGHLPKLREMEFIRMKNVRIIGSPAGVASNSGAARNATIVYPSLTKLRLIDLPKLEEWVEVFPQLEVLYIESCPKLTRMAATCFPSLRKLDIHSGPAYGFKIPKAFSSCAISFPKLTHLTLRGNDFSGTLEIDDALISSFSALTRLDIYHFKALTVIPETVANLPSLEELSITGCANLESLPTFHQSHTIRHLYIRGCSILKQRCDEESGQEWYKIQHIPLVNIY